MANKNINLQSAEINNDAKYPNLVNNPLKAKIKTRFANQMKGKKYNKK